MNRRRVALGVALLVVGLAGLSFSSFEVREEVVIDAPPERVWAVIIDFPSYAEWNSQLAWLGGTAAPDATLKLRLSAEGAEPYEFQPVVLDGLMHYDCSAFMKTALLPATRVAPALRKRVEDLLEEGETVSSFVEAAVTQHADARASQREFIKRGLAAEQEGDWVTPAAVFKAVREAASRGKRKARG